MALRGCAVTVVLVVSLSVTGLAAAQEQPKKSAGATGANGEYRIGPEDVLDIAVWNNTAVSRAVPVRPDGRISIPLLNDVQAAGLTPMQLRDILATRLAEYVPTPEVSVIVREVRSFIVSVIGEVRTPGRYEFRSWATVLDVLARAGSFNDFASRGRIFVLRVNGPGMTRIPFNYNKVIAADGEHENFFLQAGDIVVVP
jgi:polysaccharide biosynthesis/export protein